MNIKQALKLKNKLVTQMKEQYEIAKAHNSIEQGNPRRYSALDAINKAVELSNSLIELKTKIHLANAPVYGLIFQMSELKNQIKQLKSLPVDEGKVTERYGSITTIKEAEINIAERDGIVKSIEIQIEEIQDKLDTHNTITEL
jgi:methionyl-tRNA formyltransferase